jgi:hypothetical protein
VAASDPLALTWRLSGGQPADRACSSSTAQEQDREITDALSARIERARNGHDAADGSRDRWLRRSTRPGREHRSAATGTDRAAHSRQPSDLARAGVRRISVGTAIAQAAYGSGRAGRPRASGHRYVRGDGAEPDVPELNALFVGD